MHVTYWLCLTYAHLSLHPPLAFLVRIITATWTSRQSARASFCKASEAALAAGTATRAPPLPRASPSPPTSPGPRRPAGQPRQPRVQPPSSHRAASTTPSKRTDNELTEWKDSLKRVTVSWDRTRLLRKLKGDPAGVTRIIPKECNPPGDTAPLGIQPPGGATPWGEPPPGGNHPLGGRSSRRWTTSGDLHIYRPKVPVSLYCT